MTRHGHEHLHHGGSGFHVTSSSLEHESAEGAHVGQETHKASRFKRKCAVDNVSPALTWSGAPAGTVSFALTIVDIDAPDPHAPVAPLTHWVVFNIPADTTSLPEGWSSSKGTREHGLHAGIEEGVNDFKSPHYTGPDPAKGTHRYVIKVYALDTTLSLGGKTTKESLEAAVAGHILGEAEMQATYSNSS